MSVQFLEGMGKMEVPPGASPIITYATVFKASIRRKCLICTFKPDDVLRNIDHSGNGGIGEGAVEHLAKKPSDFC